VSTSATQIEKWEDCKRKFAWQYLDRVPGPVKIEKAELGIKVHGVLNEWFRTACLPNINTLEGAIAMGGIHHWPPPQEVHESERKWKLTFDGIEYVGVGDLCFFQDGRLVVGDHKTTSSFIWAKTAEDLKKDPQALLYAIEAFSRYDVQELELRWVYNLTGKKRSTKKVSLTVLREETFDTARKRLTPVAREIEEVKAKGLKALDLEPNVHACAGFGGCPYREHCNLTPAQKIGALMAQESTIKEKIAARQAAKAGQSAVNPPETAVNPPAPPVPAATGSSRLAAIKAGNVISMPAPAQAPVETPVQAPPTAAAPVAKAAAPAPAVEKSPRVKKATEDAIDFKGKLREFQLLALEQIRSDVNTDAAIEFLKRTI
jgi:hypothetical protein